MNAGTQLVLPSVRRIALLLPLALLLAAGPAFAIFPVDDGDRVVLPGNVPRQLTAARDLGPSDPALPMESMTLLLAPSPRVRTSLDALLAAQHDPASALYHRWITPQEFGRRFGASDEALATVVDWLQGHGFAVDGIAVGRQWVNFSGIASQAEEAFRTPIHDFAAERAVRHANVAEPSIPRALAPFVAGVLSLHDFPRRHAAPGERRRLDRIEPAINFQGGDHGIGPADFAVQYDVDPLYASGIDGAGVSIAVIGRTDIKLSDVRAFRSFFGLPANDPAFIHNGPDPGDLGSGGLPDGDLEESEADLDVEWTGAVAPRASIEFVISKSAASDGVDLSAQYAVDHNIAAVLSSSFGACERDLESGNAFYEALWRQAAAEGITVFTPSGDSGPAECDDAGASSATAVSVSGLCSTPWNVCVGGTLFDDSDSARYWSASEDPSTRRSLQSRVPEIVWNESGTTAGGSGLLATGGGRSVIYPKPSWQQAPGVPNDGRRDVPDVSLNAASHDGYVVFQDYDPASGTVFVVNGTSASTAAWAGLMALVVQSQGGRRQGNANPVLYRMGNAQYSGGSARVFYDVVSGDNSVPGETGFSASPGYDLSTGLGTVDASALVHAWTAFAAPPRVVRPAPGPHPARVRTRPPP
jgi:subtilase family serine protease